MSRTTPASVPLEASGVGQRFLDPITLLVRLQRRIAVGGSYTVYEVTGFPARHGAGPAVQGSFAAGTVTLDALLGISHFTDELRLTLQLVF